MQKDSLSFDFYHPNPLLIVVSGPSGVGKDSVVKELMERMHNMHFVITTTSRPMRENEREGVDYNFISKNDFEAMIAADELIEYALVYDQYKGVPKNQVRDAFASGKDVIMRVDVQGSARFKQIFPEAVLVFLSPSSEEELLFRLRDRGTETEESISLRMATTRKELEYVPIFDYVVFNPAGKLNQAVDMLEAIINAEHHKVNHRKVSI